MSIQVQSHHLALVIQILKKWLSSCEVWTFGSRVNGNSKTHSDLDLVIVSESPLPIETLAKLKDAFSESDLPFKVDLIEWSMISESFQSVIKRRYEVVTKI